MINSVHLLFNMGMSYHTAHMCRVGLMSGVTIKFQASCLLVQLARHAYETTTKELPSANVSQQVYVTLHCEISTQHKQILKGKAVQSFNFRAYSYPYSSDFCINPFEADINFYFFIILCTLTQYHCLGLYLSMSVHIR